MSNLWLKTDEGLVPVGGGSGGGDTTEAFLDLVGDGNLPNLVVPPSTDVLLQPGIEAVNIGGFTTDGAGTWFVPLDGQYLMTATAVLGENGDLPEILHQFTISMGGAAKTTQRSWGPDENIIALSGTADLKAGDAVSCALWHNSPTDMEGRRAPSRMQLTRIGSGGSGSGGDEILTGSGPNGSWTKFPDGTMEQWHTWTAQWSIDTPYVSLFISSPNANWFFEEPFFEPPVVTLGKAVHSNAATWGMVESSFVDSAYFRLFDVQSRALADVSFMAHAIGRWKAP